MHKVFAFGLLLVGFCFPASADAGPADVVEQFHQSLERGKAEAALAVLADDVMIYEQGWVEKSKAEYAEHHLASDIEFSKAVKTSTTGVDVLVDGGMAVVMSQSTTNGTFEGKAVNSNGLETMVLRKVDGDWKIVHIHWSSRKVK